MLQEQVAEFLDIRGMQRRYPGTVCVLACGGALLSTSCMCVCVCVCVCACVCVCEPQGIGYECNLLHVFDCFRAPENLILAAYILEYKEAVFSLNLSIAVDKDIETFG